jgi:hypothetical protein
MLTDPAKFRNFIEHRSSSTTRVRQATLAGNVLHPIYPEPNADDLQDLWVDPIRVVRTAWQEMREVESWRAL